MPQSSAADDEGEQPVPTDTTKSYNFEPSNLQGCLVSWEKPCFRHSSKFKQLIARFSVNTSKGLEAVVSKAHATALSHPSFSRGTWLKPKIFQPNYADKLDADQLLFYVLAPSLVREVAENLADYLVERCSDTTLAEAFRETHDHHGSAMLEAWQNEAKAKAIEFESTSQEQMADMLAAGISDLDSASFDSMKVAYESLNREISAPYPPGTVAHHLVAMATKHDKDFKRDLTVELTVQSAKGDLEKSVTAIRKLLKERERDAKRAAASVARARALAASSGAPAPDPRLADRATPGGKRPHPADVRAYSVEDGACRHCKKLGHWSRECPDKDKKVSGAAKKNKTRREAAKLAKADLAQQQQALLAQQQQLAAATRAATAAALAAPAAPAPLSAGAAQVAAGALMDADVAALQQLLGSVPAPARTLGSASMAAGGAPPSLSGPPPPSSDSVICGDTEGDDAASGAGSGDEDAEDDESVASLVQSDSDDDDSGDDGDDSDTTASLRSGFGSPPAPAAPVRTPTSAAPVHAPKPSPPPAPSLLPPDSPAARASIGSLTPDSSISEIRSVLRSIDAPIPLYVGGRDSRTKVDILNDARCHADLEPREWAIGSRRARPADVRREPAADHSHRFFCCGVVVAFSVMVNVLVLGAAVMYGLSRSTAFTTDFHIGAGPGAPAPVAPLAPARQLYLLALPALLVLLLFFEIARLAFAAQDKRGGRRRPAPSPPSSHTSPPPPSGAPSNPYDGLCAKLWFRLRRVTLDGGDPWVITTLVFALALVPVFRAGAYLISSRHRPMRGWSRRTVFHALVARGRYDSAAIGRTALATARRLSRGARCATRIVRSCALSVARAVFATAATAQSASAAAPRAVWAAPRLARWGGGKFLKLFIALALFALSFDLRCAEPEPTRIPLWKTSLTPREAKHAGRACIGAARTACPVWLRDDLRARLPAIAAIVDSGATWHVHTRRSDLINVVATENECIVAADGSEHPVTAVGDLPVVARNQNGKPFVYTVRRVRLVPSFTNTLLSVDQFWKEAKIEARFADVNALDCRHPSLSSPLRLPFVHRDGLFTWDVAGCASVGPQSIPRAPEPTSTSPPASAKLASAEIHRADTTSHVRVLPPDEAGFAMHHRLHLGATRLRMLPDLTTDAPASLRRLQNISCEWCTEANATRLSHGPERKSSAPPDGLYSPSYPGRLVHADIAGPFRSSTVGHFRYFLLLVDDHSRHKSVYFLRKKSEAPDRIREFVAEFRAHAGASAIDRKEIIGTLHSDNAGEFLSRDFGEFLDQAGIHHTTCPPHVHQLNGVAERGIRSVVSLARSSLVSGGANASFWTFAVEHAVDVLNRCTGPASSGKSSHELLKGEKPSVLGIMPFGCRAFTVKPIDSLRKSNWDPHSRVGINLGRVRTTPGAYHVWLPKTSQVISTSDAYFAEQLMPWRPADRQRVHISIPIAPPPTSAPGHPSPLPPISAAVASTPSPPTSLADAYHRATRNGSAARSSREVLFLFSGAYARAEGLPSFLRARGISTVCVDNSADLGRPEHDILDDEYYTKLVEWVRSGRFLAIVASPPCSTFSVSRLLHSPDSADGGPPPVRDRAHPSGLPHVPAAHRSELSRANKLVSRTVYLLLLASSVGTEYVLEHPADRGDRSAKGIFLDARHAPIWRLPEVDLLRRRTRAALATFPLCELGANVQKYTTLLFSAGFAPTLAALDGLRCSHSWHDDLVGGQKRDDKVWTSASAAAYPADFNLLLARAISLLRGPPLRDAPPPPTPPCGRAGRDERHEEGPPATPRTPPSPFVPPAGVAVELQGDVAPDYDLDIGPEDDDEITGLLSPIRDRRAARVWHDRDANPTLTRSRSRAGALLCCAGLLSFGAPSPWTPIERRVPIAAAAACLAKPSAADPKNQQEAYAQDRPGWVAAEVSELDNHADNGSFEWRKRSELPRGRKLVKLVWVYKVKRSGQLKARLCVQGCAQVPGVDYDQTWCGAMRTPTLRVLASVAAKLGMRMRRWDFVAAYLQGELLEGEDVWCSPPRGHVKLDSDGVPMVCKVVKPIYGMAQAGRRWQRSLFPWLRDWGFTQLHGDSSVFIHSRTVQTPSGPRKESIILGCYVDDLFVLYSHDDRSSEYARFTRDLAARWNVEDEGPVSDLLNVEISTEGKQVVLRQASYIDRLVRDYLPDGVPNSFTADMAPCGKEIDKQVADALALTDPPDPTLLKQYQSLVGALLYCATNSRPDVAYAVGMLCRAMGKPTPELLDSARRVLYYLHRHRDVGLHYEADARRLHGYTDSDWGVKHSTSGHVFMHSSAAITWGSKKQATVALSSCEAEIVAGSEAAKEAVYLRALFAEVGLVDPDPTAVGMDNTAARQLSYNPEHHARVKHIERRHFFIREAVEDLRIRVPFVSTADNLADFFTKPLPGKAFFPLRDKIMNCGSRAWGGASNRGR